MRWAQEAGSGRDGSGTWTGTEWGRVFWVVAAGDFFVTRQWMS